MQTLSGQRPSKRFQRKFFILHFMRLFFATQVYIAGSFPCDWMGAFPSCLNLLFRRTLTEMS